MTAGHLAEHLFDVRTTSIRGATRLDDRTRKRQVATIELPAGRIGQGSTAYRRPAPISRDRHGAARSSPPALSRPVVQPCGARLKWFATSNRCSARSSAVMLASSHTAAQGMRRWTSHVARRESVNRPPLDPVVQDFVGAIPGWDERDQRGQPPECRVHRLLGCPVHQGRRVAIGTTLPNRPTASAFPGW